MAQGNFTYDSAEEDWDLPTLQFINSQLENYLKMVGIQITVWISGRNRLYCEQVKRVRDAQISLAISIYI